MKKTKGFILLNQSYNFLKNSREHDLFIQSKDLCKNKRKYIQQTLCMTLDDCAELITSNKCIVKIDVDGPEYEIIESAKDFLSSSKVESVLIEINSKCENDKHKIFNLMQSYGFNKIYQGNWIDKYKMFEIANYFFFKSSMLNLTDKNQKLLFKEVILKV